MVSPTSHRRNSLCQAYAGLRSWLRVALVRKARAIRAREILEGLAEEQYHTSAPCCGFWRTAYRCIRALRPTSNRLDLPGAVVCRLYAPDADPDGRRSWLETRATARFCFDMASEANLAMNAEWRRGPRPAGRSSSIRDNPKTWSSSMATNPAHDWPQRGSARILSVSITGWCPETTWVFTGSCRKRHGLL